MRKASKATKAMIKQMISILVIQSILTPAFRFIESSQDFFVLLVRKTGESEHLLLVVLDRIEERV